jgi:hypothetical protein
MSNIGGKKKEVTSYESPVKKVGLFEGKVVAINPDIEEYKEVLGIELKEDSKSTEYLGKSQDGNTTLRVDVWLEEAKSKDKFRVSFFLEDKERENKDQTKKQYINNIGITSWAADESDLPTWFAKRDYRVAYVGEAELMEFFRNWLSGIDYSADSAELMLEWRKAISGNFKEWKDEIGGKYTRTVGVLATVKTVEKEDGPVSYQSIYSKAFFPGYAIKQMRQVDFNNQDVVRQLKFKPSKELKPYERFVLNVVGEYGCKEYYTFKDLHEYDPASNLVESNAFISDDGGDF